MRDISRKVLIDNIDMEDLRQIIQEAIKPLTSEIARINGQKIFTTNEIAKILKKDKRTIIRYCKEGIIESSKVGGTYVITAEQLNNYITPKL